MRRVLGKIVLLACAVPSLAGCCLGTWFWDGDRAYNVDLGNLGSGDQVVSSPNEGKPWQGDKVERNFGW
jgi:hypothetical protein